MSYRSTISALCRLSLTVLLGACGAPDPEPSVPPNVIVVVVDTLRAENLGAYGHNRPTSPNFDRLAKESYLFEEARAQAPCTFPSANTILTGMAADRFLGQPEQRIGVPRKIPSLAERLRDLGYATVAVSASPIVRATPSDFNPRGGFGRGFDVFDERCEWHGGDCINRKTVGYLDILREPFFLYLHYLDPHDPFNPPQRWKRRFAGEGAGLPEWARQGDPKPVAQMLREDPDAVIDADTLAHLRNLYDEEIAFFDAQLGAMIATLRDRGLLDRSLLWVAADHGEEFLEHGRVKHCNFLFDTEIKTPLLLRLPGQTTGQRITGLTANIDIVPTVLDYLGIETTGQLDGRSLRPLVADGEPVNELVFSTWGALRSVFDGRFKLVFDLTNKRAQLFDLSADPGEQTDVADQYPDDLRRLQYALAEWLKKVGASATAGQAAEDHLRALGYIQ